MKKDAKAVNFVLPLPVDIVLMDTKRINSKGYHPATVIEMDKCIGCANCAMICPDMVITVERKKFKGGGDWIGKSVNERNEAIGAAAIKAGCRYYFGYPITPSSELPEYLSRELPKVDGVFLQAESETAAINMLYGAAGAGARAMTGSSSPGISLKQEGISI